eukprot:CAMPEP_0198303184 /NCGR_PEP_ID=MMETSP1449-20131203/56757_1 /TAXON_ID=420275 /ORGANISM="Attheya septentrionalis, Strain CCMP2084" /LENGTH=171 /DNA_ID=CAMNT_0044005669 /DNA_START=50 /DNA_END=568 /DNA_ORIENTATION=+
MTSSTLLHSMVVRRSLRLAATAIKSRMMASPLLYYQGGGVNKAVSITRTTSSSSRPPFDGHLKPQQMQVIDDHFKTIDGLGFCDDNAQDDNLERQNKKQEEPFLDHHRKDGLFAVDAPDGQYDGFVKEEMIHVDCLIGEAAEMEDKETIETLHTLDQKVREYHARDPEHDW